MADGRGGLNPVLRDGAVQVWRSLGNINWNLARKRVAYNTPEISTKTQLFTKTVLLRYSTKLQVQKYDVDTENKRIDRSRTSPIY